MVKDYQSTVVIFDHMTCGCTMTCGQRLSLQCHVVKDYQSTMSCGQRLSTMSCGQRLSVYNVMVKDYRLIIFDPHDIVDYQSDNL